MTIWNLELRTFLRHIWQIGAIKIDIQKRFRLVHHDTDPDYPLSPIFFNFRTTDNPKSGPFTEYEVNFIGDLFWRYAKEMRLSFGGIVGVPNGGKPFAKAMVIEAYKQDGVAYPFVDLVKVRDDFGKEHVGKIIDTDDFSPARPALAVEDAITKATRLLETVFFFRGEGYQIYDALVFLDRQEGGQRRLSDVGVNLYSILTMGMVVEFYFEEGFIKDPEYRAIREYREHVRKYQKQVRA